MLVSDRTCAWWRFVAVAVLVGVLALAGCVGSPTPIAEPTAAPGATALAEPTIVPQPTLAPEPTTAAVGRGGGALTFGLRQEVDSLDPHVSPYAVSMNVYMNIFDSLVWYDPGKQEAVPWLATSWEVSPNNLEWTFHLREDVKFHDGTTLDAQAVKYNFDRIVDPATKSSMSLSMLGSAYEGTEVVDTYTVKLSFSEVPGALLTTLSSGFLGMVSPTAAQQSGPDEFGRHPVGSGPFMLGSWEQKDRIVLTKNPGYNWAPVTRLHQGPAYLDEVVFVTIPEDGTRLAALEAGEVGATEFLPYVEIPRLQKDPRFNVVVKIRTGLVEGLDINPTVAPTDDLRVRQAVLHAVDLPSIVEALYFGIDGVGHSPLVSSAPCFDKTLEADYPYAYDPDKARALLEEAGWKVGEAGGIRAKDGESLHMVAAVASLMRPATESIQGQLRDIGIDLEVQEITIPVWLDTCSKGGVNMISMGWGGGGPEVLQGGFGSENIGVAYNCAHFSSEEFDRLVRTAATTVDSQERCSLYQKAQRIVMDSAVYIPVHEEAMVVGTAANVHDIGFDFSSYYRYLYDTWVETK